MKLKQKYFIDSHKGITPLFILGLMAYYNDWNNLIGFIYLALHGTYGLLWITKSYIFPDKQWEKETSIFYGLFIWLGLSLYWISPYIIISSNHFFPLLSTEPTNIYFASCISIYIVGIFLHFTSDMQKHIHLELRPGHLIDNYMFSRLRNTNYLGEFFIYLGFTLLACDWAPLIALFIFIAFIWIPNMIKKDKSLSRYEKFSEYKKRTSRFFPFIY
jgi:steroid 5-alpha reductase family enzyme